MSPSMFVLAMDDGSAWVRGITIATIIVLAYGAALWIAMVVWVYRDAAGRTASPLWRAGAAGMVLVANIPGMLLYLALRPQEPLVESFNRQLEAEAFLREVSRDATCTSCRRTVEADYAFCPYCTARLQTPCDACARLLQASWTLCPYCGAGATGPARAERASERTRPSAPAAAAAPTAAAARAARRPRQQPLHGPAGAGS